MWKWLLFVPAGILQVAPSKATSALSIKIYNLRRDWLVCRCLDQSVVQTRTVSELTKVPVSQVSWWGVQGRPHGHRHVPPEEKDREGDWLTSHLSLSGLSPVTTEGATRQTVRTFTPSRLISTRCGRSFNWTENEAVISHDDAPSLTQWASHHAWTVWAWCKYRHWDGAEEKMCRMSQIKYLLFVVLWYSICLWPQLMYSCMYCVIWLLFDMLHIKWQQILIN